MARNRIVFSVLAISVVLGLVWAFSALNDNDGNFVDERNSRKQKTSLTRKTGKRKLGKVNVEVAGKNKRALRPIEACRGAYDHLSSAERRLGENLQNALDASNRKETFAAAEKALASSCQELRIDAIEALGWFGAEGLPELTPYMADADEEVAEAARTAWEQGLSDVESANLRMRYALMALKTISNEDAVTMIGGQFTNAALELIDDEEDEKRARAKRVEIVQGLVDMIEGDQLAKSEVGKELYKDLTGHEWISIEEAELYLNNPEGYETPAGHDETSGREEVPASENPLSDMNEEI